MQYRYTNTNFGQSYPCGQRYPGQRHSYTVETLYSTIPYTMIFYTTRWAHGPQNLQRPIRTLIVLLGLRIKQIFV